MPFSLKNNFVLNPWVLFFIFLAANSLLSFYPCSLQNKLFLLLFGLFLPLVVALKAINETPVPEKNSTDRFHQVFVIFFLLAALNHLAHLTRLPPWPLSDEGYEGALGISLLNRWDWRLLWSPIPHEPLLDWMLGLYFKIVPPSFFSFRLFSSLISLAAVLAAYWGARGFLSRRLSFLFALILAFSYWGLVLSHLCNVAILIPLWQGLAFGCLGRLLKTRTHTGLWGAGLIACEILGFYSWTNWAGAALGLTLLLALAAGREKRVSKTYLLVYGLCLGAALIPLALARLAPGGMAHWGDLARFSFLKAAFYNLVGLFWDGSASFPYGSLWGGFFNPVMDSLILMGLIFFWRRANPRERWVWPLVVLFSFLPALLASGDVELLRALPLMVFLTLAAAAGAGGLLAKGHWNTVAAVFILILSFGADNWNYQTRYADPGFAPEKHLATVMAYDGVWQELRTQCRDSGPLDVFNTFNTDYNNRTLDIALYPFNVLQNPALAGSKPRWAALLVHPDYAAYFEKTYPHGKLTRWNEKTALVMIPLADIPGPTLERWKEADSVFRDVNLKWLKKNPTSDWALLGLSLAAMPDDWKKDPFLTAVTKEKLGFLFYLDKRFDTAAQIYGAALRGCPAAHLYEDLGLSLQALGKNKEAQDNFEKALRLSKE